MSDLVLMHLVNVFHSVFDVWKDVLHIFWSLPLVQYGRLQPDWSRHVQGVYGPSDV